MIYNNNILHTSQLKYLLIILLGIIACISNAQTKINSKVLHNLYKVSDTIYRCEQPDNKGFEELEKLGIKSTLNLRFYHNDHNEGKKSKINLYRVKMNAHHIKDEDIVKTLQILQNAPKPIVVHCKHGADRTGVIIAMYRIIYQNFTKEQALNELINGGYGFHPIFKNIPEYIQNVDIEKIKQQITFK